ncbi:MAG: ComEC/Rec2 family competence protein [Anaerolineales bacterium]
MTLPLLWVSLAFLSGIVLNRFLRAPLDVWLIITLIPIIDAMFLRRRVARLASLNVWLVAAVCIALLLGAMRYQQTIQKITPADVSWYNDRKYDVLVTGTLTDPPDYRDAYTNLRLNVKQIDNGNKSFNVSGLLLAHVPINQTYEYGDEIRLRGQLQTPPQDEDFSYQDYLARQGILSYMPISEATLLPGNDGNPISRAIYSFKEKAVENIYRLLPDPEASVLASMLLGVNGGLSDPIQQAFRDTGTAYVIAVSGFKISILTGVFVTLFSRIFGARRGAILAILGIAFYTFLVGANDAAVRAALMVTLALFAEQIGRRTQGLNTLAFVAALMALWNPLVLWDAGFQISFFATLGLILYMEPLQRTTENLLMRYFPQWNAQQVIKYVLYYFLLTLAVQLTTIPIMAYQFKQIPLIALIANPSITPVQPIVMLLGGLAILLSFSFFSLGQLIAWIAWPLTAYTIRMVELFDRVPHGTIPLGNFSVAFVVLFYAVLLTLTFAGSRIKEFIASLYRRFTNLSSITILIVLLIVAILSWRVVANTSDGKLHITFLDVGSADAVLIQTPSGRHILINGGPTESSLSDALGERISLLNRNLDWLIIASTNENEVTSLPRVLLRYQPANVLWSGNQGASFSSIQLAGWLAQQSIPITLAKVGQTLDLGSGVTLKVLDVSPLGSTLLIEWNGFKALLPIGENFDTLDNLQNGKTVGPVTVLLLSQSGYAPLTPPEWIQNLNPRLVVLSVAAGDQSGLPDQDTLDALNGYSLLRTDRNGWIEVTTDGQQMWTVTQK